MSYLRRGTQEVLGGCTNIWTRGQVIRVTYRQIEERWSEPIVSGWWKRSGRRWGSWRRCLRRSWSS